MLYTLIESLVKTEVNENLIMKIAVGERETFFRIS